MPKAENSSPPKKWKERESIIAPRSADDREEEKPFSTNRIVGSMAEKGRGKQSRICLQMGRSRGGHRKSRR